MDSMSAFVRGAAALAAGATHKVFDWHKAATLIREREASDAGAGLGDDWEYTGGRILCDGKPIAKDDTYTYLSSNWATPELEVDGDVIDCFVLDTPETNPNEWDAHTYWPDSALAILSEAQTGGEGGQ